MTLGLLKKLPSLNLKNVLNRICGKFNELAIMLKPEHPEKRQDAKIKSKTGDVCLPYE